jgi:hypothetical protein
MDSRPANSEQGRRERIQEIAVAVERYRRAGMGVPDEWLDEYYALLAQEQQQR